METDLEKPKLTTEELNSNNSAAGDDSLNYMSIVESHVENETFGRETLSLEDCLARNVEVVMIAVQGIAKNMSISHEEYKLLSKELSEIQIIYNVDKHDKVEETRRIRNKCAVLKRDINVLKERVSTITKKLMNQVEHIDDVRRLNQVYIKEMANTRNIKSAQVNCNRVIRTTVVRARSNIRDMMGAYKSGVTRSVSLRRNIIEEVIAPSRNLARSKDEQFDPMQALPQIQAWELRARDLVKHRIRLSIVKNYQKVNVIVNYQERMDDFDFALNYIKEKESIPDLEEIISTIERNGIIMKEACTKDAINVVQSDNIKTKMVKIQREVDQMRILLKENLDFEREHNSQVEGKDKYIKKKLISVRRELEQCSNEYA